MVLEQWPQQHLSSRCTQNLSHSNTVHTDVPRTFATATFAKPMYPEPEPRLYFQVDVPRRADPVETLTIMSQSTVTHLRTVDSIVEPPPRPSLDFLCVDSCCPSDTATALAHTILLQQTMTHEKFDDFLALSRLDLMGQRSPSSTPRGEGSSFHPPTRRIR